MGEDTNGGGADLNRIQWQRFDGGFVEAEPLLGCRRTSTVATMARQLAADEPIFHVQVDYRYDSLLPEAFASTILGSRLRQTATYRGRGSIFHPVQAVLGYPVRDNCASATGV